GPISFENITFFLSNFIRCNKYRSVTLLLGDHRKPNPGVPGGRLNHGATGSKYALSLSAFDHFESNTILNGPTWVHKLTFDKDSRFNIGTDGIVFDQLSITNEF